MTNERFERLFKTTDQYDNYIRMGKTDEWIFTFFANCYKRETVQEWFMFYKMAVGDNG